MPHPIPVVLIIPARNEESALGAALARVPRDVIGRIIVADGDSTDGTRTVAEAAGATVIQAGRGYGRACYLGAQHAPADAICVFMDGDGSDRVDLVERLLEPIRRGSHDFVVASRLRGVREPGSMGFHQLAIGWVMGAMVKLLHGTRYTDMCAFRVIRRDALMRLGMEEMSFGWNLEMQIRAARAGLRILEVPMPYSCRAGGESKVSGRFGTTIRVGVQLCGVLLRTCVAPRQIR